MRKNLLLLFCALIASALIAELFLRLVYPVSHVSYFVDPQVGTLLKPNQSGREVGLEFDVSVKTNSDGFNDEEHSIPKSPGTYRVLIVGDSFIEARQVPREQSLSRVLKAALSKCMPGRDIEVINLGVTGNGPPQYYRLLEVKGLRYKPDLTIMAVYLGNDFADSSQILNATPTSPYYEINPDGSLRYVPPQSTGSQKGLRSLAQRSALLRLIRAASTNSSVEDFLVNLGIINRVRSRNAKVRGEVPADWLVLRKDPPETELHAEKIASRMIRESFNAAKSSGSEFLVVTIPEFVTVTERWREALELYGLELSNEWDFERANRLVLEAGQADGYRVLPLIKPLRDDYLKNHLALYHRRDGHLNIRGTQVSGEAIAQKICASPR